MHKRHAKFWLDDGSLIIPIKSDLYKVHRTLLFRHSLALAKWPTKSYWLPSVDDVLQRDPTEFALIPEDVAVRMRSEDMVPLLEHLYHDVPLSVDTPFTRLASIIRVSSPKQLDFPAIYKFAAELLERMFPSGPEPFTHPDCLGEALDLAVEYEIQSIQKGLYYSLVVTSDFDTDTDGTDPPISSPHTNGAPTERVPPLPATRHLPPAAAQRCTRLMHALISHFTPILFTPASTPHMACTDVFADAWMQLVIAPALQSDGVYKPLETLEKMRGVDWGREGLCESCFREKREEWRGEQEEVWRRMDGWLKVDGQDNTG